MAIAVSTKVSVEGGQPLTDYTSIAIRQDLFGHHSFQIVVPYEVLETERNDGFFHQAHRQYCGKPISIAVTPRAENPYPPLVFKGIVTHIALENSADFSNSFVLEGYSPTYLLEDGTQRRTFLKKGLRDIFGEVLKGYPQNLVQSTPPKPQHQDPLKYVVQYNESNYAFLRRLANTYGEWFYYDGTSIRLGRPAAGSPLQHTVVSTEQFSLGLELLPTRFKLKRYDYLAHQPYESSSESQSLQGLNPFNEFALQQSEALFHQPARFQVNRHVRNVGQLNTAVREWKASQSSEMVTLRGNGHNSGFGVGKTVEVAGESAKERRAYGKYRLTEVNHWIEDDMYQNTFTALPDAAEQPGADPDVQPPMAVPELAEVIDVADPQHLGRIKVRYYWSVDKPADAETGWLRVTTPYSGDGKGQLFTPEVGSQVLVGYENGLAEFPVVLGNLFHPQNKQGAKYTTPGNRLKGLQTSGGNKVVMIDTKGDQKVLISNSNNKGTAVEVGFKGDGSITLKSNGPVTVLGSTITLEAGQKGEIKLHAKNITLDAEETIKLKSGKENTTETKDFKVSATQTVAVEATNSAKLAGKMKTDVEGALVSVSGQQLVDVKGLLVKINS